MTIQLILKNDSGHVKKSIKSEHLSKSAKPRQCCSRMIFPCSTMQLKSLKPFNSSNMDVNGVVIDHKFSDLLTYTVAI